jgi:hypothetical protein
MNVLTRVFGTLTLLVTLVLGAAAAVILLPIGGWIIGLLLIILAIEYRRRHGPPEGWGQ